MPCATISESQRPPFLFAPFQSRCARNCAHDKKINAKITQQTPTFLEITTERKWLKLLEISKIFVEDYFFTEGSENPRVRGSIPRPGTSKIKGLAKQD